jgi:hypothetical protein
MGGDMTLFYSATSRLAIRFPKGWARAVRRRPSGTGTPIDAAPDRPATETGVRPAESPGDPGDSAGYYDFWPARFPLIWGMRAVHVREYESIIENCIHLNAWINVVADTSWLTGGPQRVLRQTHRATADREQGTDHG